MKAGVTADGFAFLECDWPELLQQFDNLGSGWVFRGHLDSRWPLQTSLERHTPKYLRRSDAEFRLLREFKRRAHTYLESHQVPIDDGEWLALMQHFGAPTRLLDVTQSPYVATYFAIEDLVEGTEHGAVWAIRRGWCFEAAGKIILSAEKTDRNVWVKMIEESGIPSTLTPELIAGVAAAQTIDQIWLRQKTAMVLPYEPERLSARLSTQQGAFLVPRNVDESFVDNLKALGDHKGHVFKFLIPMTERGRALEQLRLMNITRASLFPGLDGFAQSFRQLLIGESPEAKFERIKRQAILEGLKSSINKQRDQENASNTEPADVD